MRKILGIGIIVLMLVACGETDPSPTIIVSTPAPLATNTPQAITDVPAATTAPTAAPTDDIPATTEPSPTPTPIVGSVLSSPQTLAEDGVLTIDAIVAPEDVWLTLWSNETLVVAEPLAAGDYADVELTVSPLEVADELRVALYVQDGGTFSADTTPPLLANNEPVASTFSVELNITRPSLNVVDQTIFEDGLVTINSFLVRDPGWVAIYADDEGDLGKRLGLIYVEAGVQNNVQVPILWRQATLTLHAVMHVDDERIGRFDYPDSDPIVAVLNDEVRMSFSAELPPDVFVLDQPVVDNQITIDHILSPINGWIVAYFEAEEGVPGNIIGSTQVEAGINQNVVIDVADAITPILYLQFHEDTNDIGEFEFPNFDPAYRYQEQPIFFQFNTEPGNYIVSADQALQQNGDTTVLTMPLVVADIDLWVVIRADNEGLIGDPIGQTWLSPGINRNVTIEINADEATPMLHAVLHIDRDEPQVFEFPDGRDFELQRRQAPIDSPFMLLEE